MNTTHRIGIGVVLALALALASAASASARLVDLNANGSEVPAGAASMQTTAKDTTNAASPFVQAASARVAHQLAARDAVRDTAVASTSPHSEVIDNGGYGPPNIPPVVLGATAGSSGFDWGDAGHRRRRRHRPHDDRAWRNARSVATPHPPRNRPAELTASTRTPSPSGIQIMTARPQRPDTTSQLGRGGRNRRGRTRCPRGG